MPKIRVPKIGYVYLLFSSDGKYKIGASVNPYRRLRQLSTGTATPPRLVHTILTDDMFRLESIWHQAYKHLRCRGEWYNLTCKEVDDICSYGRVFYNGGFNVTRIVI